MSMVGGSTKLNNTSRNLRFPPSLSPLAVAQTSKLGVANKAYKL